ncbi:hypothetical protein GQQ15_06190 [Pantoea agglomerans]|uniref:hypothetical protein n=1 Tax=Enterobacter agglomerans TaxID=549 RepID=UPI0013B98CE4|nr:hypothetical protein [Pantoea agglomerans]NEG85050.1 hypothetical protein [Pantoea agglomerans]NEH06997.1 hypothetical protein [Pantoea agglomerans]
MEKLNELAYRAERYLITKSESQPEQINVSCKTILAIAEAFRALEQRASNLNDGWLNAIAERDEARAKLAELEKQEPAAWLVLNSSEGYVERNPDVVAFLEAAGLTKCKPLFTRPAPAAELADLVPDKMPTSHIYHGGNGAFNAGKESGWNACRAAMLRNIEEAQ